MSAQDDGGVPDPPDPPESTGASQLPEADGPLPGRWRILGFLGVAQLMLILDVTVVAIALPHIETDLGLGRETLTWTVSAYTLTFGGLMLLGGRLVDLFGGKCLVLVGLVLFSAASLVTGLADSGALLVGGRVAQGVGAATLSPAGLSLVVGLFAGEERNKALGVWSALGGGGAALGVLLGGLLTAGPGWPWVFYINVPLGLVIAVALAVLLPPHRPVTTDRPRLDVLGAVLVTASSAALIYVLIAAGDDGWFTTATWTLLPAAAVGYTAFVVWQRRARSPLMDVRLLARRPVATGAFLILMATAVMIAVFFLGTFYFQHARGYGALRTGLLFLPVAVATMIGAQVTGRVIGRVGGRVPAVVGLILAAGGMVLPVVTLRPATVTLGVTVAALGTGALFVIASATALGQVAPHEAGIASGVVSTFHEFGASLGAAVTSTVAAASLTGATLDGYTDGFALAAIASVVAAAIAALLTPGRGPAGS